jgi:PAS domain S-box-containing protein
MIVQVILLLVAAVFMQRRSSESALRRAESKARSLVERVPAIVYQVQFGSTVSWRYVSPRIKSILGFTPEEWMADSQLWFKQIHPEDREEVLAKGLTSSLSGKPFVCEYRMYARDGRLIWFRDEGNVVRDRERKSAMIQGVMMDITEKKRAEILQGVIYRLAEKTSSFQTINEYFNSVHQSLSEFMHATNFYVGLYDPSSQRFTFPYVVNERSFSMDPDNALKGLPGYVIVNGPLLADSEKLAELTRSGQVEDDGVPFVSWLGVPLKSKEKILGVLSVQSFSADQKFVCEDLNAMLLLAAEVAAVLEQKQSEKALRDKSAQLEGINEVMTVFLKTSDWKASCQLILNHALSETDSEYGFIGVVAEEQVLRIFAHAGLVWDQQANREFYEGALRNYEEKGYFEFRNLKNLFGSVITQDSAVISNHPKEDQRSGHCLPLGHPPLNCFLGVPLHHADQVIGLIGVANRPGGYSNADLNKLNSLSQTTAVLYHSHLQTQKLDLLRYTES